MIRQIGSSLQKFSSNRIKKKKKRKNDKEKRAQERYYQHTFEEAFVGCAVVSQDTQQTDESSQEKESGKSGATIGLAL